MTLLDKSACAVRVQADSTLHYETLCTLVERPVIRGRNRNLSLRYRHASEYNVGDDSEVTTVNHMFQYAELLTDHNALQTKYNLLPSTRMFDVL